MYMLIFLLLFPSFVMPLHCIFMMQVLGLYINLHSDGVFVGGPSGSGKTSLAQKMANIVGCEVISLESYYKPEQLKDFKYDEYSSLDISLLSKVFLHILALKLICSHIIRLCY